MPSLRRSWRHRLRASAILIVLPWMDSRLSPNAKRRTHWRVYQPAIKAGREAARLLTFDAMQKHLATAAHLNGEAPLPLVVRFYPPDRRRRDDDGMVGSFKHFRDGIADALGVNDRRFRPHYFFEDSCPPGRVEVEFSQIVPQPTCGEVDSCPVDGLPQ